MNILVVYSTRTGNTQKVGQAIFDALPGHKTFLSVEEAEGESSFYDLVFAGFWLIENRLISIAAFSQPYAVCQRSTLCYSGSYPDSEHARLCLIHGAALLPSGTHLWDHLSARGASIRHLPRAQPPVILWDILIL